METMTRSSGNTCEGYKVTVASREWKLRNEVIRNGPAKCSGPTPWLDERVEFSLRTANSAGSLFSREPEKGLHRGQRRGQTMTHRQNSTGPRNSRGSCVSGAALPADPSGTLVR